MNKNDKRFISNVYVYDNFIISTTKEYEKQ